MTSRTSILFIGLAVLGLQLSAFADAPTTAPSDNLSVADVRVQTLKPYTYAFVSGKTTIAKIQDAIPKLMAPLDAAMDAGKLQTLGPVIFTYHGSTGDPNKEFTLDVGFIVKDGTAAPEGVQIVKVGPDHCATLIYAGAAGAIGSGYGKLYGEIGRRGLQPTDVCREVYFWWENPDSQNNLIQIQAVLGS